MSRGQKAFNVFNIAFMVLLMIVTLYPFYYVICASFSSSTYLQVHRGFLITPVKATLGAYKKTFNHALILSGFANIFKRISENEICRQRQTGHFAKSGVKILLKALALLCKALNIRV